MVYSATQAEKAKSKRRPDAAYSETRAIITVDDRRYVLDGPTATLGRSKEADCIIDDPNISRRHAELRRSSVGDWQIVDLNSTNGVKVNGRRVARPPVAGRRDHPRDQGLRFRHRAVNDLEPLAVALKFGFLAVLYLFLLWVRGWRCATCAAPPHLDSRPAT
jgi:hypothetical protein